MRDETNPYDVKAVVGEGMTWFSKQAVMKAMIRSPFAIVSDPKGPFIENNHPIDSKVYMKPYNKTSR